jgi:hypothetical protein
MKQDRALIHQKFSLSVFHFHGLLRLKSLVDQQRSPSRCKQGMPTCAPWTPLVTCPGCYAIII